MSKNAKESTGVVKRHPDGFGFFISDVADDPDVYIPRKGMDGVMSNDRVRVRITREPGGDRFRGEILEVVARNTKRAMGEYHETAPGKGTLSDRSFIWGADLNVECPPHFNAKDGDLVAVQIESYPDSDKGFAGKIIAVLGDMQDPLNDAVRMLHTHSIPSEFSKKAIAEANALPLEVTKADMNGRRDLRDVSIITIDGATAKDFDDAVFVEKTASGFHLIVAIADVSHYVKPDSGIDDDAYVRGTSTYFPSFVAPMLPEKLSNELCSLKPKVARLALVADMQLDFAGLLTGSEFYEGVIESKARVTYGQAQEVVEGKTPPEFKSVEENILRCADLARILMAKRFREGSLDLDIPETIIELDDGGQPVDIIQSERLFAHRLIEELMLTANVAVAKFFKEKNVEGIYRIHEAPLDDATKNFQTFLNAFGFNKNLSGGHLAKKMTKALEHFKGHPKEHVLHILALRSLSQAKYSPNNVGHFGLGFPDYTHFTSPIRRYPDLIVHRVLKAILYPEKGYGFISHEKLEQAGSFLSACEQRSVKAERQIKSIKKARFMGQHLGEEFEGMISSVTKFGIFVLLRQFDVDGLIRLEELGDDFFQFDEENLRLVGKKSGLTYEIGEPVKVIVAKADIEQGQIDMVLAEKPKRRSARPAKEREVWGRGAKKKGEQKSDERSKKKNRRKKSYGKKDRDERKPEKRLEPSTTPRVGGPKAKAATPAPAPKRPTLRARFQQAIGFGRKKEKPKAKEDADPVETVQKRGASETDRGRVRQSRFSKRPRSR